MWYRYEMHMHSCQGSKCGKSPCADMVRAYHAAGYAGAVLTDHFIWGNTAIPRDLPWEERMQGYYDAYLSAKPIADELDFDLIFGFEHQYGHNKEILVYGIGVDFLKANADIPDITLAEFCDRIHAAGGYISHAHPFRFRPYMVEGFFPADTSHCDALEVYNFADGYDHPEYNEKSEDLCASLGLARTSGADSHWQDYIGIGKAGMAFPERVHTPQELVAMLKSGKGKLIVGGELKDTLFE